ncbi:hypothetical protein OG422_29475 [Streptomyces sp. NBC_01525]
MKTGCWAKQPVAEQVSGGVLDVARAVEGKMRRRWVFANTARFRPLSAETDWKRRPVTSSSGWQRVTVQYDQEAPDRFAIEGWDMNVPYLLFTKLETASTLDTVTGLKGCLTWQFTDAA